MARRIVEHHISYEPEITRFVYDGEHEILGKMNWYNRKTVSRGFLTALKHYIVVNESRAKDLEAK